VSIQHIVIAAVVLLFCAACPAQENTLVLGFNNKPPLFYWENHAPKGTIVTAVKRILDRSGVAYRFEEIPFLRTIAYLKQAKPNFAALGFNKTAEREEFTIFSKPVYRDSKAQLLIRAGDADRFSAYKSFDALIDSGLFTFGGKEGNAYPIDAQLKRLGKNDRRFQVDPPMLAQLLVAGRFDFMILFPEELEPALRDSSVDPAAIEIVRFGDIPAGQLRYILFSKATDPSMISRINKAIPDTIPGAR